jgi:hypothetical protein
VVYGDDNFEVTGMGFREWRCAYIGCCSVWRLLFHRHFSVYVGTLVFDLCVLHHIGLYESLYGELPGENHETVVVCGGKEI